MAGIIGALVGYWFFGFLGAIGGYFLGSYFGRGLEQNLKQGYTLHSNSSDIFYTTAFSLLGYLAKADGRVSEAEIAHAEALMKKLGLHGEDRQRAIGYFKQGSAPEFDLHACLAKFNTAVRFRVDLKRNLIIFLVEMAMADDELHSQEEAALRQMAQGLGIDPRSFEQLLAMLKAQHGFAGGHYHQGNYSSASELEEAYKALGVEPSISDKDLKKAYRKLMSQYHPDKMIAKGVPKEMLEMATQKAQEIQAAYDVIEKDRKRKAA